MTAPYCALGDLVTVIGGGTPSRTDPEYWNGRIPWATVKDLKGLELTETQETITEEGIRDSAAQVIAAGNVLIATRMAVGRASMAHIDTAINQDLKALICENRLYPRYLLYYLNYSVRKLERLAKGATVKGVLADDLRNLLIPLPSLSEQRRIAAVLDRADALRRKAQEAIDLTDTLIRSTFLHMFGDPVTNPREWNTKPLGECVSFLSGGTPSKAQPDNWRGSMPWVSPKDMKQHYITDSHDHISEQVLQDTTLKVVPAQSILIVVRGMILVHTVPIALTVREVTVNQDMKAMIPGPAHQAEFLFRNLLALSPHLLSQVSTAAHGTKRLELETLKGVPVLVPPAAEQQRFVFLSSAIKRMRERNAQTICHSEELFQACLQQAFTGDLR